MNENRLFWFFKNRNDWKRKKDFIGLVLVFKEVTSDYEVKEMRHDFVVELVNSNISSLM